MCWKVGLNHLVFKVPSPALDFLTVPMKISIVVN
ncbi:hypothetical protein BofuT4_uP031670.1 [Botrytis cinerea T4]|uniref:Uncharacterized protein n=1 Tax=Botryotinia fuckeliana (strain T4) TaxID=999810 RepID=G2Y9L5_BOTF4|nr:hypothetical protein BofuT4_uP031670.1 [Botrytis cinerea T4]